MLVTSHRYLVLVNFTTPVLLNIVETSRLVIEVIADYGLVRVRYVNRDGRDWLEFWVQIAGETIRHSCEDPTIIEKFLGAVQKLLAEYTVYEGVK